GTLRRNADLDESSFHNNTVTAGYAVTSHMGDDVDINTLTMEQYLALNHDNIRPDIVKPEINGDVKFEINGNFMRELRRKLFKGTDDEDAHEHVRRVLEIVDLFHFPGVTHDAVMLRVFPITLSGPALRWKNRISTGLITTWKDIPTRIRLDSKEFIPMMSPAQALKSIQVMAGHSHNWYDEATTKESINDSSDNVDTKKLKENIHSIQVSRKICEGAHPTNDCPLTKEDKAVEQSKEKELEYDIPLQNGEMQPFSPQIVHITPLDNDFVAPATSPILDKHLNEFREEFSDITRVAKKADGNLVNDVKELLDIIKTYDFETFIQKLLHQVCLVISGEMRLLEKCLMGIHPMSPSYEA
ncbi:hypothetical protein Tco_0927960, partial [Tanacetum coccineum]